jgi:hypothetical protein
MADSTTRISDLPENIIVQMPENQLPPQQHMQNMARQQVDPDSTSYVPINIHPNPYGIPQQTVPGLPVSQPRPNQQNQMQNQGLDPMLQQQLQQQLGSQRIPLPSRDIPMNQNEYQQDEQIQPNYMPKQKLTSDYIREYEAASEQALKEHEQKKRGEKARDNLFSDLQTPILVALLYFIFQMPIVNTLLFKYFAFLSIYNADGNINFMGLLLKSSLVGFTFYCMQYASNVLTNL